MPIIYNCHTHIFNIECVPEKFIDYGFVRLMSRNKISLFLLRALTFRRWKNDFFEKQASFLRYNTEDWQEAIFLKLKNIYPEGTKFVVLTMDMDHMGAGDAERNFLTQLTEVAVLKRKYPNELLPFIAIDPRRGNAAENRNLAKKYISDHGFSGIKMYPPLGYFPFDERMDEVYKYATEENIPVLTHCSRDGGIYYKKEVKSEWLNPLPGKIGPFTNEKMNVFRNNFMQPHNYFPVLEKHPDLKICIAHYAGAEEMLSGKADSWYETIKKLIRTYPNVYADISYTLYNEKVFDQLKEDIQDPVLGERILFGTDFYMTEREKKEKQLKDDFHLFLGGDLFTKISYTNVKRFLTTKRDLYN